jgi:hypothetical protein
MQVQCKCKCFKFVVKINEFTVIHNNMQINRCPTIMNIKSLLYNKIEIDIIQYLENRCQNIIVKSQP